MNQFIHSLEFAVRDYECDLQGIVNNAVYQHYLEHARHDFLRSRGIDFAALARAGVFLVVARIEMDFLSPLTSGDRFVAGLTTERLSPLRIGFLQTILRLPDEKPVLRAKVVATARKPNGKPFFPPELEGLL